MKTDEILRSIGNKEMEIIQRRVRVNYDNRLQSPLSFSYQNKEHRVTGLLGRFRGDLSPKDTTYLIMTHGGGCVPPLSPFSRSLARKFSVSMPLDIELSGIEG